MPGRITPKEYRALAALRYRIRLFLREGDAAARRAGVEPQQYLLMLAVQGLPGDSEPTIQVLAEQMTLKHNSTVELIDRLEQRGYVRRNRSREDRRRVLVSLLPPGERLVAKVAGQRITELRAEGIALANAIDALLGRRLKSRGMSKNDGSRKSRKATNNPERGRRNG